MYIYNFFPYPSCSFLNRNTHIFNILRRWLYLSQHNYRLYSVHSFPWFFPSEPLISCMYNISYLLSLNFTFHDSLARVYLGYYFPIHHSKQKSVFLRKPHCQRAAEPCVASKKIQCIVMLHLSTSYKCGYHLSSGILSGTCDCVNVFLDLFLFFLMK